MKTATSAAGWLTVAALVLGPFGAGADTGFDAVREDPRPAEPAASMDSLAIPSGGDNMNAIIYVPGGPGPHPVAFVLHGLPGNERNLDLAHAMRRAGWAVLFFHYRGAWGSAGDFTFSGVVEDVHAAIAHSLTPEVRSRFRLDGEPRALVGHSMGGWAALMAGAQDEQVACVGSLAGADLGALAAGLAHAPESAQAQAAAGLQVYADGPLAGTSGAAMVAEVLAGAEALSTVARAEALARLPLLMVAGARDVDTPMEAHHTPLYNALLTHDARVTSVFLNDDHAFSESRLALADALIRWMEEHCR